jgi:two-component system sensor histidine kinase KdpD
MPEDATFAPDVPVTVPPPRLAPVALSRWSVSAPLAYVLAVLVVGVSTAVALGMYRLLGYDSVRSDLSNLVMVYLLGVVLVAALLGRGPAVVASVLSVAAFDFFFVPPFRTFVVNDQQYVFTFLVMLAVAMLITTLTDRVRAQAELARRRERRTAALLELSRALAATRDVDAVARVAAEQTGGLFHAEVAVFTAGEKGAVKRVATSPPELTVDDPARRAAQSAFDHGYLVFTGPGAPPDSSGVYRPLIASRGPVGVLGLRPSVRSRLSDPEQQRLLEAFANLVAAAMERAHLAEDARVAWERVEAEFLRNTLLSSVSHDLRTPLAAISGAAEALTHADGGIDNSARRELAETVLGESQRMSRVITNLLDMTRLESGGLVLKREWQPLAEVVGAALRHVEPALRGRAVRTDLPADLPMVLIDAVSMEQVLINLLDNATEYTSPGTPIELTARATAGGVELEIADHGPGVPVGKEEQIFQKFYRSHGATNGGRRGIGLGLAICRGVVEAHGGTISANNRAGGGATFTITLPVEGAPPTVDALES